MNNELKWIPLSERMPTDAEFLSCEVWAMPHYTRTIPKKIDSGFAKGHFSHFCPIPKQQPPPIPSTLADKKPVYLYGDNPEFGLRQEGDEMWYENRWSKTIVYGSWGNENRTDKQNWRRKLPTSSTAQQAKTDVDRCIEHICTAPELVKINTLAMHHTVSEIFKWQTSQKQPQQQDGRVISIITRIIAGSRPYKESDYYQQWQEEIIPRLEELIGLTFPAQNQLTHQRQDSGLDRLQAAATFDNLIIGVDDRIEGQYYFIQKESTKENFCGQTLSAALDAYEKGQGK